MAYGSRVHKKIYYSSPGFVKNLAASVYGVQQRALRYGKEFDRHLAMLAESQHWENDRLEEYQQKALMSFVRSAVRDVPFYRDREEYQSCLNGGRIDELPLLPKKAVREHRQAFTHPGLDRIEHMMMHTSGTSGEALVFPVDASCFQREYAYREIHYSWGGVSLKGKDRFAFCAGHPVAQPGRTRPPFWVYDSANRHLFFSSYHLTEANLPHYVRKLESFDPVMIGGYPSSVYLLALAYRKHGKGTLTPRAVYTFSETLLAFQRAAIQEVFGCKVFNWYGNTEMCANIVECEAGELHLKLEHSFVEILNDDDLPCKPGESGRLVCTGFGNPAFPLIRYDIGDSVRLSPDQASKCGRGGILVDEVLGRVEDYVATPDGRIVGRLDHIFKDSVNVSEAQVVQDSVNEVVLRIVRSAEYSSADEEQILEEARLRLGDAVRIELEYVERIPRSANGKFRFVESSLDRREILVGLVD